MHSHPNRPPVSVFLRGPMSRKRAASIAVSGVLVLFAFLLTVSINGNTPHAAAQAPNQSGWRPPGIGPSSTTPHEKFATFFTGDNFKAILLLENVRPDKPITAKPSLILDEGEIPLDPVTLPAHSTATVDLSAFMVAHGYTDKRGTVSVRFDFQSYGPLIAVAQSTDQAHYIYLNSFAQSPEEYWAGTAFDAVVWAPDAGTKGFVSITNTAHEPRSVRFTTLVNGHSEVLPAIQIPSRKTSLLPIDGLLGQSSENGAGIHVEFDEYPGDILVEGQLFNAKTGFAKYIHFADKALQYPTATLRTHFVLLGSQPAEDGFPAGMSFRSVAAVRNIDSTSMNVTPSVKFLNNGSVRTIALPSLPLGAGESRTIDLSSQQNSGLLPPDLHQASLELVPDNDHGNIVAELFNFSASSGGYTIGPSFTSYPNHGSASIWRTDGSFQTTIMVENTAAQDDEVTLKLFSDWGTYSKILPIPAGGLLKINVKELEQDAVPDQVGNVVSGTYGMVSVVGSHGNRSKLSFDKLIHSADESDYVGLPPNPCDYVMGIALYLDLSGGQNPFPVIQDWIWSQSPVETYNAQQTTTSTPSLVTITPTQNGDMATINFGPGSSGQTMFFTGPPVGTTVCDACSSGDVYPQGSQYVPPHIDSISPAQGLVGTTLSAANGNPVIINGSGFGTSPTVQTGSGITVTVTNAKDTQITASFAIASNATGGFYLVFVTMTGSDGYTHNSNVVDFYVQLPTSIAFNSVTVLPDGTSGAFGCPSFNAGIRVDIKYQVMDQEYPPLAIRSASMIPHESGKLFSGASFDNNIGPVPGYPTSGTYTAADGTFHDVPLGVCAGGTFSSLTATQNITMLIGTASYAVRSQTWTATGTSIGHGTISNTIISPGSGSDVSASR